MGEKMPENDWSGVEFQIALRTCRDCGLKAYTEEDLERFVSLPDHPTGRLNWCKECSNKYAVEYRRRKSEATQRDCICVDCGKVYPEELRRRPSIFHVEDRNVDIELCQSCTMKRHWRRARG